MTYVYKKYEVKIKMVQELKMKFLLIYNNCASELDSYMWELVRGSQEKAKYLVHMCIVWCQLKSVIFLLS